MTLLSLKKGTKIIKNTLLVIMLLTLSNCSTSVAQQRPGEDIASSIAPELAPGKEERPKPVIISNTLGVLVVSNSYDKGDFIQIYNEDGSLWHRFTFFYVDIDGKFEYAKDDFRPLAFTPGYSVLVLTCAGKDKNRYEVIVDEETGLKKFVNIDDSTLKFETWEEHVRRFVGNQFDQEQNPLHESPDGKLLDPPLITLETQVSGEEINGDWIRIEWRNVIQPLDDEPDYSSAWVRWRKDGVLLIELQYLC